MSVNICDIDLNCRQYFRALVNVLELRPENGVKMESNQYPFIEIKLYTAHLLIGKTMKTMQRWCEDGKIASRVVDLRGKRVVSLESVLPFTSLSFADSDLVKQADGGDCDAQNEIGIILLESKKSEIALEWFREAAKSRHADAMHFLFQYYVTGNMGVAKDEHLAISWLAASAAQGHIIAKAQIRSLFDKGLLSS